MQDRPTTFSIGDSIADRWRIEALLGTGGHACVYRVVRAGIPRIDTPRRAALKVLCTPRCESEGVELRRRFHREAAIGRALRGLHVPRVHELFETEGGDLCLVMELIEGEDLQGRIEHRGPLSIPAAMDLGAQMLEALSELGSLGLVHRDLKPSNVMLQPLARGGLVAKLIDFGIGSAPASEATPRLTGRGVLLGTPEYMAPEQIRGEPADPRTDLHALGVLLFEAVSGALPFEGAGACATLAKVLTEPAPDLRARAPWCPPSFASWVQRALAKTPEERFADADAMAAELGRVADFLKVPRGASAWAAPWDVASVAGGGLRPSKRPAARARPRIPP